MTRTSFHGVIVPVVRDTEGHVVPVVFSEEEGHFIPDLTFITELFLPDGAAFLAVPTAHASHWYLHGKHDEHDVEHGTLAEPKGQVTRHSVIGIEVGDDLETDHHEVEIEHLPVEPSPFCLVLGFLLLGFV